MARLLSLAHLSVLDATPPEVIVAASSAGFDAVGLRLVPARDGELQHPMIGDTPMRRETLSRMADSGVSVFDVEVIWLRPVTDIAAYQGMFETAARLGARRVIAASGDPDMQRAAATFGALCDLALLYGLTIDLEFIRWTEMKSLVAAQRLLQASDRSNAGILVDCLHAARAGVGAQEVAAIDPRHIGYFQLCDAPATPPLNGDLAYEAKSDRLPPGEGGLPLLEMIRALPPDTPASVEVPMIGKHGELAPAARARLLASAARHVLGLSR